MDEKVIAEVQALRADLGDYWPRIEDSDVVINLLSRASRLLGLFDETYNLRLLVECASVIDSILSQSTGSYTRYLSLVKTREQLRDLYYQQAHRSLMQ